jgi:hypothetical protein
MQKFRLLYIKDKMFFLSIFIYEVKQKGKFEILNFQKKIAHTNPFLESPNSQSFINYSYFFRGSDRRYSYPSLSEAWRPDQISRPMCWPSQTKWRILRWGNISPVFVLQTSFANLATNFGGEISKVWRTDLCYLLLYVGWK